MSGGRYMHMLGELGREFRRSPREALREFANDFAREALQDIPLRNGRRVLTTSADLRTYYRSVYEAVIDGVTSGNPALSTPSQRIRAIESMMEAGGIDLPAGDMNRIARRIEARSMEISHSRMRAREVAGERPIQGARGPVEMPDSRIRSAEETRTRRLEVRQEALREGVTEYSQKVTTGIARALETGEVTEEFISDVGRLADHHRALGLSSRHPTADGYRTAGEVLEAISEGKGVSPRLLNELPNMIRSEAAEAAARRVGQAAPAVAEAGGDAARLSGGDIAANLISKISGGSRFDVEATFNQLRAAMRQEGTLVVGDATRASAAKTLQRLATATPNNPVTTGDLQHLQNMAQRHFPFGRVNTEGVPQLSALDRLSNGVTNIPGLNLFAKPLRWATTGSQASADVVRGGLFPSIGRGMDMSLPRGTSGLAKLTIGATALGTVAVMGTSAPDDGVASQQGNIPVEMQEAGDGTPLGQARDLLYGTQRDGSLFGDFGNYIYYNVDIIADGKDSTLAHAQLSSAYNADPEHVGPAIIHRYNELVASGTAVPGYIQQVYLDMQERITAATAAEGNLIESQGKKNQQEIAAREAADQQARQEASRLGASMENARVMQTEGGEEVMSVERRLGMVMNSINSSREGNAKVLLPGSLTAILNREAGADGNPTLTVDEAERVIASADFQTAVEGLPLSIAEKDQIYTAVSGGLIPVVR